MAESIIQANLKHNAEQALASIDLVANFARLATVTDAVSRLTEIRDAVDTKLSELTKTDIQTGQQG